MTSLRGRSSLELDPDVYQIPSMALITHDHAEQILNSPSNLINQVEHHNGGFKSRLEVKPLRPNNGQGGCPTKHGQPTRELIGTLANLDTTKAVSESFNIPESTIKNWKHGRTSRLNEATETNFKEAIDRNLGRVRSTALDKLMDTLGLLTTDKLKDANAIQLASVADKMGNLIVKTSPQSSTGTNVNVVVFTPNQRSLHDFDVLEIEASAS